MNDDKTIGRKVLAFLEDHHLPPTPANYHLGHLYITDGNRRIVEEIGTYASDKLRIRQADADAMMQRHNDHAADDDDADADPETGHDTRRQEEVDAFMAIAIGLMKETRKATGELTTGLAEESAMLTSDLDLETLRNTALRMLERSRKAETDLRAATQKIKRLQSDLTEARTSSLVDELSKLPNRRAAKQLLERLEEDRIPSAIAIVDIDHFKRVNDTFGHPVGDRVIAHVGRILTETMAPDMVARWGGEEYLVIAQEGSSETLAERLDRARMEVASRKLKVRETDAQLGDITFSAGVATSSENSTDAMEKADALLYEAKQSGRNRICSSSKSKAA